MPTKSEFSIRKLIPQRKTEDDTTPFPPTPPPEKTHWLQPRKPTLAGRRGAADPPVLGGTESLREIISPVPLPDAPYSCPSPPFARASGEFGWAARREVRRSMSPRARSGLWEDGLGGMGTVGGPPVRATSLPSPLSLGEGVGDRVEVVSRPSTPLRQSHPSPEHPEPRASLSPPAAPRPSTTDRVEMTPRPFTPLRQSHPLPEHTEPRLSLSPPQPVPRPSPTPLQPVLRSSHSPTPSQQPVLRPSRPSTPLQLSDISLQPNRRDSIVPVTVISTDDFPRRVRSPPAKVPVRKASVKKTKKRRRNPQLKSPKKTARDQPRWTISENVADLFTGQLFRRLEADEVIAPEQVEAFRRRRESAEEEEGRLEEEERIEEEERMEVMERLEEEERAAEEMKAFEAGTRETERDADETPHEPFYLENLATRVEAMLSTPADRKEGFDELVRRDFAVRRKPVPSNPVSPLTPDSPIPIPPKNPARQRRSQMPTIAELRAPSTPPPAPFDAHEDDEYVFLKSTPCTLTAPAFRHGPIRVSKADLKPAVEQDNTLDWTAFQMAILGAGDFFCESPLESWSEEEEIAGLGAWFDDFGFETHGRLVPASEAGAESERAVPSPEISELSPASCSSSCCSEDDLPIPIEAEFSGGPWGCGVRRWVGTQRRRRASEESMPQSPMLPIKVPSTEDKGEVIEVGIGRERIVGAWAGVGDVVPMGYNLGHDLGDFLRWEAENVYAMGV